MRVSGYCLATGLSLMESGGVFQLFLEVDEGCRQHASTAGITLPTTFSIAHVFEEMAAKGTLNAPLLRAASMLRRNGGCWGAVGYPYSIRVEKTSEIPKSNPSPPHRAH